MALHCNLIDGPWTAGEAAPNRSLGDVNDGVGEDTRAAVAAAEAAFPGWSRSGPLERQGVLRGAADAQGCFAEEVYTTVKAAFALV